MDFSNHGQPQGGSADQGQSDIRVNVTKSSGHKKESKGDWSKSKLFRVCQSLLSLCVLVVVVGLIVMLAVSDWSNISEGSYVQDGRLQAVYLANGQVLAGKVKALNSNYLVLNDVFVVNEASTSTAASPSVSVVKLGCDLSSSVDKVVVDKAQVTLWENLSTNDQVSKAVSNWQSSGTNAGKCVDQSTLAALSQPPTTVAPVTTTPATSTSTTSTSTTK